MDLDPVTHLTRLSTAVTARVLRTIADSLDNHPNTTPPKETPLVVLHVAHLTINEAPARTPFRRNHKS